jgi:hypothetical protein
LASLNGITVSGHDLSLFSTVSTGATIHRLVTALSGHAVNNVSLREDLFLKLKTTPLLAIY